jgi:hypothetical protein
MLLLLRCCCCCCCCCWAATAAYVHVLGAGVSSMMCTLHLLFSFSQQFVSLYQLSLSMA